MVASGGGPASGCKFNSYLRNTTTRSPLYSDVGLATPTTNPYVGDADGRLSFYFNDAIEYEWVVTTSDGATTLWEAEVVGGVLTVTYSNGILIDTSWAAPLATDLGSNWPTVLGADVDILTPEMFGTSADWGAAFTAMFAAMPTNNGRCRLRAGVSYTISTAVTCTGKNFFELDMAGATIVQGYTGGALFTFGDGTVLMQNVTIRGHGGLINGGTTANQPVFYTRGVRDFKTLDIRALNVWQWHKWGNPADTYHSYIWTNTCEVAMRTNASGGHSDAVQGDGSLGIYYGICDKFTGDAVNVAAEVVVLRLTSGQQSSFAAANRRFDSLNRVNSQWDTFDWGIKAVDARLVNYDKDETSRDDQMVGGGIYSEVQAAAVNGGGEKWSLRGTCSSVTAATNSIVAQIVAGNNASFGYTAIDISGFCSGARASPVNISQTGSGVVSSLRVDGLTIYDFQPSDAVQYGVKLDGTITGVVDNVTLRGKAGATYQAAYTVYNNTGAAVQMQIGANIGGVGHVNTAVLYHPNPGTTVGRFSGVRTDGTPYGAWSSATDRLFGRDTAAAGPAEEITVSGGIEFTGSGGIQRSALTGEVAASAGSNTTTVGTVSALKLTGAGGAAGGVPLRGFLPSGTFLDDTAQAITAFSAGECGFLFVATTAEYAIILFECAGTPSLTSISASANVVLTTGILSGTTGTDARLNISIDTSTRIVYIENRLGGSITLRCILFGGY
jgi:hypothetical protein